MVWQHITFLIIWSLEPGRPNIQLGKIILLYTKDEDKKLQI
jgi:hypothetical protein